MKKKLFWLGLSLGLTSSVSADYLQPRDGVIALLSDGFNIVADDFRFSQDTQIETLRWWGGNALQPPIPDDFIIQLFADDDGKPGSLLSEFSVGTITKTSTGHFLLVNGMPGPEFHYSADLLSPFVAQADTRYWLSIANYLNNWGWTSSLSAENWGVQRIFYPDQSQWRASVIFNMAFELVPVPEPSAAALFMCGIIATLVCNKRSLA